ncbi:MAG: extracellular solute-binding protein [Planctomycetes bacterium]|nr:extracellular solute-binding protein [Planctomycetota bacterium]
MTKPFRGQEVELVMPGSLQLPALWEVALHEWMDETGATIRWSEYQGSDAESLEATLANPPAAGGRLILFPLRKLSELDSHLAPIEGHGIDMKDLFKGLRERIVSRDRTPIALPISAPVLLCYFRADLLKRAGLKPPETWEEYQSLLDSLDKWAPGLTALEPLGPDHRASLFFARSLAYAKHPENYSVWFDLNSGRPVLDSAGFLEAMESADRAWKTMPVNIAELSPADCRALVLDGKAALAIGVEPDAVNSVKSVRAPSIEIGVCRLPGSRRVYNPNSKRWDTPAQAVVHAPALCAFDGMALGVSLPKDSTGESAAWHLMSTLAGEQFELNWAALPKSPCRESQVGTATSWQDSGLTLEESSQAVDATAQMLRDNQLVADLPIPNSGDFRRATAQVLEKVLTHELDAANAIQLLQSEFQRLVEQAGLDEIRAANRRGLGLATK